MRSFKRLALLLLLAVCGGVTLAVENTPLWLVTPSISPDGRQVAFSYQGVLYIVPVEGGSARALTSGKSYSTSPVWSPKGDKIAFASDRYGNFDIYTINVDGSDLRRLTTISGSEIPQAFTPSGDSIIYTGAYIASKESAKFPRGWLASLFRVSVKGGAESMMIPAPVQNAHFAPDGKTLLFEQRTSVENEFRKHHTSSASRDIWMYNPTSRNMTCVVKRAGEDRCPRFAPDGKSFFFLSEREGGSFNVYEQSLAGGEATPITKFAHEGEDRGRASERGSRKP